MYIVLFSPAYAVTEFRISAAVAVLAELQLEGVREGLGLQPYVSVRSSELHLVVWVSVPVLFKGKVSKAANGVCCSSLLA